ncbi:AI-2E family transporter [Actinomycetaceae bacterium MB13-C1-2]|nr:AI-2E family transporter [Actinomycetaceae bacterium MB13-C1-2]
MKSENPAPQAGESSDHDALSTSTPDEQKSALERFTANQKRTLAVMTVIVLCFGAYFLREYLELIALAAVLAYLFRPLFLRLKNRLNAGVASVLTLLSALAIVVVPVGGILTMAGIQIKQMVDTVSAWVSKTDMGQLGQRILDTVNQALDRIPYVDIELTPEKIQSAISSFATNMGEFALNLAKSSVGGIAGVVTASIIFLYVFIALLGSGDKIVVLVKDLSPLDPEVTDIYLSKIGSMVKATVGGQFVIAAVQGTLAAISIYIGGIHQGFFMFLIFLTVLSIIPLGAGIVTIPLGIGMALSGNIVGGIFVVLFHVLITSNADNVLRPVLVPRNAYLQPALMLLAVFAGLSMFGFPGIVFGPVTMIFIVTTINLYRVVLKGASWDEFEGTTETTSQKKNLWQRLKEKFGRRKKSNAS